jgi:ParB-like chromosome segregation protein Spo0J
MTMQIRQIALSRLAPHPDHANRMSRAAFRKLLHHIQQTGRYEPLVVRRHPHEPGRFQIIHGHHRFEALRTLGRAKAQAIVWNVDDEQTDLLLATLTRLAGRDQLDRKLAILRRLRDRRPLRELAKLLPQTRGQLERLTAGQPTAARSRSRTYAFATPMVFFVDDEQQAIIERALTALAEKSREPTKAARRAAALTRLAAASSAGANHHSPLPANHDVPEPMKRA